MNYPLVGLSIWDMSGWDGREKYATVDKGFYENVMVEKLQHYNNNFSVAELAQEADYLNTESNCWSNIDLIKTPGFVLFALTTSQLSLHLRHRHVDIAEAENDTHRKWSLEQVKAGVRFAFRLGANVAILHPGTHNERSGQFWPAAYELPKILEHRSRALESSLAAIASVVAEEALMKEERILAFEKLKRGVFDELSSILKELSITPRGEKRVRHLFRAIELVEQGKLTSEEIRHCVMPWGGMHLALENLEPPNFLLCTPTQIVSFLRKFESYCAEAASTKGLSDAAIERYRPGIALDPGHMLNSKVILTLEQNEGFMSAIDSSEELLGDFVNLPGQYPRGENPDFEVEPILNKFVRQNADRILWCYIHGCRRTDTCMTSHGPIRAFREAHYIERDSAGKIKTRFLMDSFRPEEELNLNEVIQVVGMDIPFITEVIGSPAEVVTGSASNLQHYLKFLWSERKIALDAVKKAIVEEASNGNESTVELRQQLDYLGKTLSRARFYVRNYPSDAGLRTAGYDEAGFYIYSDEARMGNVDIFATVKQRSGKVWLQGIHKDR